jgi:hypothetical protein
MDPPRLLRLVFEVVVNGYRRQGSTAFLVVACSWG